MTSDTKIHRMTIEAVGLRQSDAAAYALQVIGMMMREVHRKGYSCGGETGNASGNWETLETDHRRDEPGTTQLAKDHAIKMAAWPRKKVAAV